MSQLDPDQIMEDLDSSENSGSERPKRAWERGGVKIKRKKVPGAKNLRIRKYVQPKNAVMCLNELQPGLSYVTEVGRGVSMPICVSVEVDGQKYRGFGSSKAMAKQAAAEAALISFVKPPATSSDPTEDKTPWATLASFAIYKLFNEWREGRVGLCATPGQSMTDLAFTSLVGATPQPPAPVVEAKVSGTEASMEPGYPKPAKALPDNAASIHPSVVLHQMKPNVQYNIEILTRDNVKYFVATAIIDGQEFSGEGMKVKKAKYQLAKTAVKTLFDIDSIFEMTP